MKRSLAVACLVLSACAKADPTPVAPAGSVAEVPSATATATATATPTAPAKDPTAKILSNDVLAKVCAELCGGPTSSVRIYRDTSGNVRRLFRIYGSCTHSPAIYFSPDGTEGDTIPEKPITPGSAEAKKFEAIHATNTQGLTHTDTVSCRDGSRSAP